MRRTLQTLSPCLVAFLLMLTVAFAANAQELQKKLEGLKGISGIEKLESDHYAEKYLVRITQPVDHRDPAAGTFTQGSSIELSCDGPIRPPYIAYMQGGLTYDYGKLGLISAIEHLRK